MAPWPGLWDQAAAAFPPMFLARKKGWLPMWVMVAMGMVGGLRKRGCFSLENRELEGGQL